MSQYACYLFCSCLILSFLVCCPGSQGKRNFKSSEHSLNSCTAAHTHAVFTCPSEANGESKELLKQWTAEEITIVKERLYTIFTLAPRQFEDLLSKLEFRRSIQITRLKTPPLMEIPAETDRYTGTITIADAFFTDTKLEQLKTLAHELAHVADCGYHLSLSAEWTAFAYSSIEPIQDRLKTIEPEAINQFDNYLRANKVWPGVHAAANLHEALAACFSSTLFNEKYYGDETFKQKFLPLFLDVSSERTKWNQHYRSGALFFLQHNYDGVIHELNVCTKLFPGDVMAHIQLARIYLYQNNFDFSIKHLRTARLLMIVNKIPNSEVIKANTDMMLSDLLCRIGEYSAAEAILIEFVDCNPLNASAKSLLKRCQDEIAKAKTDVK